MKNAPVLAALAVLVLLLGAMAPGALALDKDAFVETVNSRYYNATERGLKGFDCEIGVSVFDQVRDLLKQQFEPGDPALKTLDNIKFRYIYGGPDNVRFESTEHSIASNAEIEKILQEMVIGVENIARIFFQTWTDFTMTEPFSDSDTIKKIKKGKVFEVRLVDKRTGTKITVTIDKDYRIGRYLVISSDKTQTDTLTEFIDTPHGYIISSYDVDINEGYMHLAADIDYREHGGFKFPSTVRFANETMGEQQEYQFYVNDCKVMR